MILSARDHNVVVNGNSSSEMAVSSSRNIFLFVKLKYSSIVCKWFILASSVMFGFIFSYRLASSLRIIYNSMLFTPFWKLSVIFSTRILNTVSIFSFNRSFFFLNVPNTICQRSSCGKFSTKFLISLALTSNDALLFRSEINKFKDSSKI